MLCQRGQTAALPLIKEEIVIKVGGEPVPQCAVYAEVDDPRQRGQRHAAEVRPHAAAQLRKPAAPQVERRQHHDPREVEAQHRVLEPERAPGQKALHTDRAQRLGTGTVQRPDQAEQRRCQKRQQQLLGAAAVGERAAGRHARCGQRHPPRRKAAARQQLRRAQTRVQKRRNGDDFQHQHAAEVCAADKARQPVQQVEHRALVVEHVTVKHHAAEHGAAHREEDVCVHPVVEGVERRRLAAQSQQHRRQRRQPDDARQP